MKNSRQPIAHSQQKRRGFLLVTSYCLLVTALLGCAKREIKNINSAGKNIICFGDSITFGYGAGRGEDYPTALAKMIAIPVINTGIDGDTSTEALLRFKSDVLDRDPLLVIIEFGGNDFLRKVSQETTVNNVRQIIRESQARGAMAAVIDISAGMFLSEYRQALSELAKQEGAIFIPQILRGIVTNPRMKSDFLHPNADGYNIIAQHVYRTIIPYLNQNTLSKKFAKKKI